MLINLMASLSVAAPPIPFHDPATSAIVHATVAESAACTSDDGAAAWTFVRLEIHEELLGSTAPGSDGTFWLRQKYGTYPDGTIGGLVGTPVLFPGDEVVLALHGQQDSSPSVVPLGLKKPSVLRIVPTPPHDAVVGETAIVDIDGRIVMDDGGVILAGPRIRDGGARFPGASPLDPAVLGDIVGSFAAQLAIDVEFRQLTGAGKLASREQLLAAIREAKNEFSWSGSVVQSMPFDPGNCNMTLSASSGD